MNHLIQVHLALLAVGTIGFSLPSGIQADDNPKSNPAMAAAIPEAAKPKPLGDAARRGLAYLVRQQNPNGGWGQGGGWRVGGQGSRDDGTEIQDPPDVGDTSIAVLALVRSGSTPKEGKFAKEVGRGIAFICSHVEKSDSESLYVTDIKGTQIQSKIGPYVDTFLASIVLAELKGKMADDQGNKMLMAALGKTIGKIEKNQQADGTFAGNTGNATVLSQGLANKGLNRAAQAGVAVKCETLDRIQCQVTGNFDEKAKTFKPTGDNVATNGFARGGDSKVGGRNFNGRGGPAPTATSPSDAGVSIYGNSSNLTNTADQVNTLRMAEKKAKETLESKSASKEDKEKAEITLKKAAQAKWLCTESTNGVVKQLEDPAFVQGFGSNGGEEFLSFMNISEALLLKGGEEWKNWDKAMSESLTRVQDRDGSWSGHHCITGKTFCTATALLVLMADRAPIPAGDRVAPREDSYNRGVIGK